MDSTVSPTVRFSWMDRVRGIAIVLLLIWHSSAIPQMLGMQIPGAVRVMNFFFTPFRMPTLMLLSGMLLAKSLRKGPASYYVGKFAKIGWPYFVWVCIAKLVFLDVEGMPWYHWRAWYATSYLWFLFFIGVYYFVAPLFTQLPKVALIAIPAVIGVLLHQGSTEQRLAYFAIFFFAGYWISFYPDFVSRMNRNKIVLAWAVIAIVYGLASARWPATLQYNVWSATGSLAGFFVIVYLCSTKSWRGWVTRYLELCGRNSIVFYVSHFPVMVIVTKVLGPLLGFGLTTIINLVSAALVAYVLLSLGRRWPWLWLFESPRLVTRGVDKVLRPLER